MRRATRALVIFILTAYTLSAQEKEKPAPPPSSLAGAPIIALERQMVEAEKAHDLKFIDSTLAPDFLEIAGDGRLYTKPEIMEVVKDVQIDDYALDNFHVSMLGDDIAIVSYEVSVRASYKGQSFPARNHLSSTWRRQKRRWQMVFHTSTPVPQPAVGAPQLEGLEQDLVARESAKDAETLKRLFAADAIIAGPDGKLYSAADLAAAIGRGANMARKMSEVTVQQLGPDSGLVTYRLEVQPPEGAAAAYRSATLWKRGPLGWQVVFHQDTLVK